MPNTFFFGSEEMSKNPRKIVLNTFVDLIIDSYLQTYNTQRKKTMQFLFMFSNLAIL